MKIDNGEMTLEEAESVNDLAYEKYVSEDKSDIDVYYAKRREMDYRRSQYGHKPDRNDFYRDDDVEEFKRAGALRNRAAGEKDLVTGKTIVNNKKRYDDANEGNKIRTAILKGHEEDRKRKREVRKQGKPPEPQTRMQVIRRIDDTSQPKTKMSTRYIDKSEINKEPVKKKSFLQRISDKFK
jgi:hypothetical protein